MNHTNNRRAAQPRPKHDITWQRDQRHYFRSPQRYRNNQHAENPTTDTLEVRWTQTLPSISYTYKYNSQTPGRKSPKQTHENSCSKSSAENQKISDTNTSSNIKNNPLKVVDINLFGESTAPCKIKQEFEETEPQIKVKVEPSDDASELAGQESNNVALNNFLLCAAAAEFVPAERKQTVPNSTQTVSTSTTITSAATNLRPLPIATEPLQIVRIEQLSPTQNETCPQVTVPVKSKTQTPGKVQAATSQIQNANDFDVLSISEMRAQEAAERQAQKFATSVPLVETGHNILELLPDVSKDFKKLKTLQSNLERIEKMRISLVDIDDICDELLKMEKLFNMEKSFILKKYAKIYNFPITCKKISIKTEETTTTTPALLPSSAPQTPPMPTIKLKISPIKLTQKLIQRTVRPKLFQEDDENDNGDIDRTTTDKQKTIEKRKLETSSERHSVSRSLSIQRSFTRSPSYRRDLNVRHARSHSRSSSISRSYSPRRHHTRSDNFRAPHSTQQSRMRSPLPQHRRNEARSLTPNSRSCTPEQNYIQKPRSPLYEEQFKRRMPPQVDNGAEWRFQQQCQYYDTTTTSNYSPAYNHMLKPPTVAPYDYNYALGTSFTPEQSVGASIPVISGMGTNTLQYNMTQPPLSVSTPPVQIVENGNVKPTSVAVQKGNLLEIVISSPKHTENNEHKEVTSTLPQQPKKKSVNLKWKEEVEKRQQHSNALSQNRCFKSILKNKKEGNENQPLESKELKKKVFFIDGIYPNDDSSEEDQKAVIEELKHKVLRLRKRYGDKHVVKVRALLAQMDMDKIEPELDALPPPPPPAGPPPSHLEQPIYLKPLSPDIYEYYHYDAVVGSMYISSSEKPMPPRLMSAKKKNSHKSSASHKHKSAKSLCAKAAPATVAGAITPAKASPVVSNALRNEFVTQPLYPSPKQNDPRLQPLPFVKPSPPAHKARIS